MSPDAKEQLAKFQVRLEQAIPDETLARLMKEQAENLSGLMFTDGQKDAIKIALSLIEEQLSESN